MLNKREEVPTLTVFTLVGVEKTGNQQADKGSSDSDPQHRTKPGFEIGRDGAQHERGCA